MVNISVKINSVKYEMWNSAKEVQQVYSFCANEWYHFSLSYTRLPKSCHVLSKTLQIQSRETYLWLFLSQNLLFHLHQRESREGGEGNISYWGRKYTQGHPESDTYCTVQLEESLLPKLSNAI